MAMRAFGLAARKRKVFARALRFPQSFDCGRGFATDQSDVSNNQSDPITIVSPSDVAEVPLEPLTAYWPPDTVVHGVDWLHATAGLEWYQAIALSTLFVRITLAPLAINMMKGASKLGRCAPELKPLTEDMKAGKITTEDYTLRAKAVYEKHGISNPFKPILLPFLQFPVFISFFWGLRKLPEYHDVTAGGIAWFTDLAVPDPYYILPVTTALGFWLAFELNADGTRNAAMPQMTIVMRCLAAAMIPITCNFPAALLVYWNVNNAFSLCQVAVLKIPGLKDKLGILPPLPLPTATTAGGSVGITGSAPIIKSEPTVDSPPIAGTRAKAPAKQKPGRKKRRSGRRRR